MGARLYKATGAAITAITRVLGIDLRVTGLERLPDQPVLFLVNHFTRFETFLIPYVVYRRFDTPVRTLAAHGLFKGVFGRYLGAVGVLSTRAPHRNRTIIGDLMTGRAHWVIYPEGGLVKTKKTVRRGRLHVTRAGRSAPPHTGAAVMALKSELRKRRYRAASTAGDRRRQRYYESHYHLHGPDDLSPTPTVVVPVNITYTRLRARRNLFQRLARLVTRELDPVLDEELQVEGSLLLGDSEISIHFGEPIPVDRYLDQATELARRVVGWFRDPRRQEVLLRRQAQRLTGTSMWTIYRSTEINLDHLFCFGLRVLKEDRVPAARFRRALYLAALELRSREDVRLHPSLMNGISALARTAPYPPLASIEQLARDEGVVTRDGDDYVVDRAAMAETHGFHTTRLRKMTGVIANEVEPVDVAVGAIRRAVNLEPVALAAQLPHAIWQSDRALFHREYDRWHEPGVSKTRDIGEPFFLDARAPKAGIVLAHGYLACPEQMRPFAEHLHANGYSVYGVRLDGHGTAPGHLHEVVWQEWLESMQQAYAAIEHRCPRRIVGGFSLGGILALLLAAELDGSPDGVFTINAPLLLQSRLASLVPAVLRLHGALSVLGRRRTPLRRDSLTESPHTNYEVDYLSSIAELRKVIRACRRRLAEVTSPTLVLQSRDDPVVDPISAERLYRGLGAETKRLAWLPSDHRHVIVRGEGSAVVFDRVVAFLDELCGVEPGSAAADAAPSRGPSARAWRRRERSPDA